MIPSRLQQRAPRFRQIATPRCAPPSFTLRAPYQSLIYLRSFTICLIQPI